MRKAKILVVDDEEEIGELVRVNLAGEGHRVFVSPSAERGLACFRRESPDLVILDMMLPGMTGLELCRIIRQESRVPILFLTAKSGEVDKLVALRMGGDDYVCKPFSINELLVRVEVLLRRAAMEGEPTARILSSGGIVIDIDRRQVLVEGKICDLPHMLFELLRELMASKGKVLSRDALLQRVWGISEAGEIDTRTVDQHVARL